jgi:ABC-type polysaccharide/polyol phosphate export permease
MDQNFKLAAMLGWQDVRQAYRRSVVGPFWITGGMAIQIATMGVVFSLIFKSDIQNYLPFLATSVIIWGFMSSVLSEGCLCFINGEAIIKQLNIPLYIHVLRVVWKNIITLGHNLVILPLVFLVIWHGVSWQLFLVVPGLVILIANLTWLATVLGALSSRFRDLPPIITSLLTVTFYVTPVMWYPTLIGNNQLAHKLLGLNPFYHLLQIVRLPILGQAPTIENWILSFVFALCGWAFTILLMNRVQKKIAYWV